MYQTGRVFTEMELRSPAVWESLSFRRFGPGAYFQRTERPRVPVIGVLVDEQLAYLRKLAELQARLIEAQRRELQGKG